MSILEVEDPDSKDLGTMVDHAHDATVFLKALAHEGRLMMLCYLAHSEKTVTDFEELLSMRQPAVSQQLMRLRGDGLVTTRREGKAIYYKIADPRVASMVTTLHGMFCAEQNSKQI